MYEHSKYACVKCTAHTHIYIHRYTWTLEITYASTRTYNQKAHIIGANPSEQEAKTSRSLYVPVLALAYTSAQASMNMCTPRACVNACCMDTGIHAHTYVYITHYIYIHIKYPTHAFEEHRFL
jgi:hypothetical protein